MNVVVAIGATVTSTADEPARPIVLVHFRVETPLRVGIGLELSDELIIVRQVSLRAVRPQVILQGRPDMRVAGDDDDDGI
jgi:hypothetical protein